MSWKLGYSTFRAAKSPFNHLAAVSRGLALSRQLLVASRLWLFNGSTILNLPFFLLCRLGRSCSSDCFFIVVSWCTHHVSDLAIGSSVSQQENRDNSKELAPRHFYTVPPPGPDPALPHRSISFLAAPAHIHNARQADSHVGILNRGAQAKKKRRSSRVY
ncbi:hypothetical protein B0H63DRAFT_470508 [Podospora didyma]|uniref:Uncharacterized protein n=1 Tax=Podospora didyma TaxID=330526 RepID=A0AAE0NTT8_9PEZI|nr:hypothetical protein B0H63DRAFT_470508 [Podospora didyma]